MKPAAAPAPIHCNDCQVRSLCLPMGLDGAGTAAFDAVVQRRFAVARGVRLLRMNTPFISLYAIRSGHFKSYQLNREGGEQVTGFRMAGDLLGVDAIDSGVHHGDAVALEDSQVCEIPLAALEGLAGRTPALLRHFHQLLGAEIARRRHAILMLGKTPARQRLAAAIVKGGSLYAERGHVGDTVALCMRHEDISNFLGMSGENFSRLLSQFKKEGLLRVGRHEIEIVDLAALRRIAGGALGN